MGAGEEVGAAPCPAPRRARLAPLPEPNSAGFSMGHQGLAQKGDGPSSLWVGDHTGPGKLPHLMDRTPRLDLGDPCRAAEGAGGPSSSSSSSRTLLAVMQASWPALLAGGSPVSREEGLNPARGLEGCAGLGYRLC